MYDELSRLALDEFADVVTHAETLGRRAKRGLIYRHDNAPDHPSISTFPKHFHNGSEDAVEESHIPDDPVIAYPVSKFDGMFIWLQLSCGTG